MARLKKVHVSELRIGMYVSKLDREWLETPFLFQGFFIEEAADVAVVAEYCEHVYVDDERTPLSQFSSSEGKLPKPSPNVSPITVDIEDEHRRVKTSFKKARTLTKTLLEDIRLGGTINTDDVKKTVDDCVKSVLRHPDALMWMSKVRESSEYTAEHCLNVCIIAIVFGRELGMSEQELQKLGLCGLLHDIGKMRVPSDVLNKPGNLSEKEMKMMKAHTVHGRNILLANRSLYTGVIDVAYSHHERVDGLGYPRKLDGAGISRFSKIISIVDAYDAMTAERCYSAAMPTTDALKIIYNERGKQFDEALALHFIKVIGIFPVGSVVELIGGEAGIIIEANRKHRHLPKVIVLTDKNKKLLAKEFIADLSLVERGEISKDSLIKRVCRDGSFGIVLREYEKKGLLLKR